MEARLLEASGLVRILGPQATLEHDYSINLDGRGKVVRSIASMRLGARIRTRLVDEEIAPVVD